MSPDELPFVVRRLRRISKESSSNVQEEAPADTKKNNEIRKGNSSNYNKWGEERNLGAILIPKSDPGQMKHQASMINCSGWICNRGLLKLWNEIKNGNEKKELCSHLKHNCQEFSQPLSCLYQAMQTQEKSFLLLLMNNIPEKKRTTLCYGTDKKRNITSRKVLHA